MEHKKITKVSENSQQYNPETVKYENDNEIPTKILKKDIYLQKKDKKLFIILILI